MIFNSKKEMLFIVLGIGFLLPGKISISDFMNVGVTNYSGNGSFIEILFCKEIHF